MIRNLQRRLTVLVLSVLLLILAGTISSINLLNWYNLKVQAEQTLSILSRNDGRRTEQSEGGFPQRPPELPAGREEPEEPPDEHPFLLDQRASLSNSYTVLLGKDGSVEDWFSDRSDLYTDEEVQALVEAVLAGGARSGRIGSQFYQLETRGRSSQLVVLDQRLEISQALRLLRLTLLVGLLSYALLGLGSVWLIRRMTRPVQEAFDKQKQFVWDASHELKTPLAVISANADVLAGEIGENEWLGYIQSEVRRTDKLVQNLLTLARMDRGTRTARRETFDLSRAVLEVALPFESSVFEAGKTMELDVEEEILCIGDAEMLQQLTVILLSNAMKYSDPAGTITLSLHRKGELRLLRVHNTGPAISPEALPHLFDRFFREDSAHNRETPGNGLGLSIAQAIVQAHRGKIAVDSTPENGTTFTVSIPFQKTGRAGGV